jgi:hypothetical protein
MVEDRLSKPSRRQPQLPFLRERSLRPLAPNLQQERLPRQRLMRSFLSPSLDRSRLRQHSHGMRNRSRRWLLS